MREILFRGMTDDGEWYVGKGVNLCWSKAFIPEEYVIKSTGVKVCDDVEVIPTTIGQFTGLTDKNGKKIFEGDIVRCISMTDMANMVVIFEDGEFRMVLCEKYKDYIPGCGFYAIRCFDKEVIGNIHDNPELLEVEG